MHTEFHTNAGRRSRFFGVILLGSLVALGSSGCATTSNRHSTAANEHMASNTDRIVAGTVADGNTNPAGLQGTTWRWVHLSAPNENVSVTDPANYTLRFDADGNATIQADCNRAGGPTRLGADGKLSINILRLSRQPCATGSLSDRFTSMLTRVDSWRVANGQLILEAAGQSSLMRFQRAS